MAARRSRQRLFDWALRACPPGVGLTLEVARRLYKVGYRCAWARFAGARPAKRAEQEVEMSRPRVHTELDHYHRVRHAITANPTHEEFARYERVRLYLGIESMSEFASTALQAFADDVERAMRRETVL